LKAVTMEEVRPGGERHVSGREEAYRKERRGEKKFREGPSTRCSGEVPFSR